MAFIGNTVQTQGFTPAIDYFNGDGTTVTFTLSRPLVSTAQVIAVIENVPQNPSTAFSVSGNSITFTSAPPSGSNNIWIEYTSLITTYNAISQDPSVIGDITATGGFLAVGDFGNTYTDGTIVDYVTGNARITTGPADGITLYNGGTASRTALMAIDSIGNVGFGTTPVTWNSSYKALQIGSTASLSGPATAAYLSNNWYSNASGTGTYITTSTAGIAGWEGNSFAFYNAPSGTAGTATTMTERMRIDASGNVGIGTTTPGSPLDIKSNIYAVGLNVRGRSPDNFGLISFSNSTGTPGSYIGSSNSNDLYLYTGGFYARMGIDSSGRVTQPDQPAFSVEGMSATIFNANTGSASYMNGGTVRINVGSCYNSTTGRFTAPISGRYWFSAAVLCNAGSGRLEGNLAVNGTSSNYNFNGTGSTYDGAVVTCILSLNANDYVTVQRQSGVAYSGHGNDYFNGYLLG